MPDALLYVCDVSRHLICVPYTRENLHRMAQALGLKQCWFHDSKTTPHYDIPVRRIDEIMQKCHVVSTREIIRIMKVARMNPSDYTKQQYDELRRRLISATPSGMPLPKLDMVDEIICEMLGEMQRKIDYLEERILLKDQAGRMK